MTPLRETLKQAGYTHVRYDRRLGLHILRSRNTNQESGWAKNKGHAGYGIKYKGTHLEFVTSNIQAFK